MFFYFIDAVPFFPSKIILTYNFLRKIIGYRRIINTTVESPNVLELEEALETSIRQTSMQNTKHKAIHVNLAP